MPRQKNEQRYNQPFDLHLHSNRSDGSEPPAEVVKRAAQQGVTLLALTDHDTVSGVSEAAAEAERAGVRLLPAIEMDAEWPNELHILGLDIDIHEAGLTSALATAMTRRYERNDEIVSRLLRAGYDIRPYLTGEAEVLTRLNIALALVEGGFAADSRDAFVRFLNRGGPGHYTVERFSPEEIIRLIRGAGGVPVWAHPMKGQADIHKLAPMLAEFGLMGLEAYHPSQSEGESVIITSIARQLRLIVTCGSDYHGAHRKDVVPGQTWREIPALLEAREFFERRDRRGKYKI